MKHWVFDLDGTLVDSFAHFFITAEDIFRQYGSEFTPELHHAFLTDPLDLLFERHLGKDAAPLAMATLRKRSREDASSILPFRELYQSVEFLAEQGARIAIWTNRDLDSAELIMKHSELDRYTELCVSGSCVSKRKPSPEGLLKIIETFQCDPSTVTMVGDHEHDVLAAKFVGCRAVRASWHSYFEVDPCKDADHQFYEKKDFLHWVKAQFPSEKLLLNKF